MTSLFPGLNLSPTDQPTPQSPPQLMFNYAGSMNEKSNFTNTLGSSPLPANSQHRHQNNPAFNTFPTPCSSAAGTVPPTTAHDIDIDVNMAGMSEDEGSCYKNTGKRRGSVSVEDQHDLYRNHGRSAGAAKRRHSVEENPRQDSEGSSSIPLQQQLFSPGQSLPLYLFCQKTYAPLYPSPTMNILPLYNLTSIAESVARFDSVTGAKKKLRKSYKGKILDLPGKNEIPPKRAPPTEPIEAGEKLSQPSNRSLGLLEMLDWPDEEWLAQKVVGKEIDRPISQDALRKSLSMVHGPIPGFDPAILGLDENERHNNVTSTSFPNKNTPSTSNSAHHSSQQPQLSPSHQPNGATPGGGSSASGSPADSRPKRIVRKKRWKYDDNSFEGYGEAFEDDDAGEEYGDDGVKKKKKRKKSEFSGGIGSVGSGIGPTATPAGTGIYAR